MTFARAGLLMRIGIEQAHLGKESQFFPDVCFFEPNSDCLSCVLTFFLWDCNVLEGWSISLLAPAAFAGDWEQSRPNIVLLTEVMCWLTHQEFGVRSHTFFVIGPTGQVATDGVVVSIFWSVLALLTPVLFAISFDSWRRGLFQPAPSLALHGLSMEPCLP